MEIQVAAAYEPGAKNSYLIAQLTVDHGCEVDDPDEHVENMCMDEILHYFNSAGRVAAEGK